jgi:hypothetical protein
MAAALRANAPRRGRTQRGSRETSSKWRDFLLWYWAIAFPRDGRVFRTIYLQPILGLALAIMSVVAGLLRWPIPLVVLPVIGVIGLAMIGFAYPVSLVYYAEYRGGFDESLEEYVARRVSRLSRDEFIPEYKTRNPSRARKIRALNRRVSLALRVEELRLAQSERTPSAPVCGVLVIGPKHANKTGALWDAMTRELGGWTFVRWPHHMDYPANLADRLGHRIVLWIDDLHDYSRSGEAAALAQFIQQLREKGRRFLVLSSCRDGTNLQEARRYFSPLIADLQLVHATEPLPLTRQFEDLMTWYSALSEMQKSILRTMDWLQSMRMYAFPEVVLKVLNGYFLDAEANQGSNMTWDEAIQGLGARPARFVRVEERSEAQAILAGKRYDLARWFRYNIFRNILRQRKTAHYHKVLEPLNVRYLDLEGSRVERAKKITAILEHQPAAVVQLLAAYPVAAETLILLGDAYLNHLGENIDNAGQLAIKCYLGAFEKLDQGASPTLFPGAWAAAHVGKGTAELRVGLRREADADFSMVTNRPEPAAGARPIPKILLARAWHGRGDVIAAQIPSGEIATQLDDAAEYYELAAQSLPRNDPLWAETMLDRANVLFELAGVATGQYSQSLAETPTQPPTDKAMAARTAYLNALEVYPHTAAPAVWAEIQRRLGELCMMETAWLLPAELRLPHRSAGVASAAFTPLTDEKKAIEAAKEARDYFIAASAVFAPSYLPTAWAQTQVGLVRALLIIARNVARQEDGTSQARDIYSQCLATTKTIAQKVSKLADTPLDWVDLQLLRAQAEIDQAPLEEDAAAHYNYAKTILGNVESLLSGYSLLSGNLTSERIPTQQGILKALLLEIKQASPGP